MSGLLAGVTLASMFAALVLVIICANHRRIRKWHRGQAWPHPAGRDEEDGLGTNAKGIVISSPQPAELAELSHEPLSPAFYAVPPPPFLLHTPPPPTPPPRAVLPPAHPSRSLQQQARPVEANRRPNVLRRPLPRPMLPSPPPPPSPIPAHRSYLVPRPLRIGPSRMNGTPSPEPILPTPVQPTISSKANEGGDNIQMKQQQQLQKQDGSNDTDPADNNGNDKSLSMSSTLRNSTATGSTGSDTTLPESPRVMTARTQAVQWVSKQPHGQSPFTKILLLATTPPQPSEETPSAKPAQQRTQTQAVTAASVQSVAGVQTTK